MRKEARLYLSADNQEVICHLCHHKCQIKPSRFGICGVRQNCEGKLYTHVYGEVIAAHVDPIEKKPLYHFLPGSNSFSMATVGCNFFCSFCQNWQISQDSKKNHPDFSGQKLLPKDIVALAQKYRCQSISYTYTEPTIFFEYAFDTARLAKEQDLFNIFVTNGYMTKEALDLISPYLDACNVDLKSFREDFYKKICKARLQPVLQSIEHMKDLGIWVEITTLIVPGLNDSEEELNQIANFVVHMDPGIPWHISRFHPDFEYLSCSATPVEILHKAYSIGKKAGLRYVYLGNVPAESEDTVCPACQEPLIQRHGFSASENRIREGKCPACGQEIQGVFNLNNPG